MSGNFFPETSHSPPLRVTLTPLQLPEASLTHERTAWAGGHNNSKTVAMNHPEVVPKLQVYPGESSQLVAHIQNHSTQAWDIQLRVSQAIPSNWYPSNSDNQLDQEEHSLPGRDVSQD